MIQQGFTVLTLACIGGSLLSCQSNDEEQAKEIVLTNQASVSLTDKAIAITRSEFSDIPDGNYFPLLISQSGDTVAAQLDDLDGNQQWDELFFVTDLAAGEEKTFRLSWIATQPEHPKRTSVRFGKREAANAPVQPKTSDTLYASGLPKSIGYQPYQTDGPSWENDKIGFRHYFDGRNAKDLFGKRVAHMSPEDVGINEEGMVEDNYHVMEDWGRDILAVGNSVGLGGFAFLINDQPARLGVTVDDSVNNIQSTTFHILTEGPVRSVMHFGYNNWQAADRNYSVEEKTSIWPGMYGYHNSVKVEGLEGDEQLLVGLVNINNDQPLTELEVNNDWVVLLTHDQQTYEKEWWLGMALILPRNVYQGYLEAPTSGDLSNSYFAKLDISGEEPVSYFAVGGWELSDKGFRDRDYFQDYVQRLTQQLSAEVKVDIQ